MNTSNVNWDVIWSSLRTALVAGGPIGALLIACGLPAVTVSTWLAIGLAIVGVASVVVPGIYGALKQTNAGKLKSAATVPDVVHIVVSDFAKDGSAVVAADPNVPKVMTVSDVKGS